MRGKRSARLLAIGLLTLWLGACASDPAPLATAPPAPGNTLSQSASSAPVVPLPPAHRPKSVEPGKNSVQIGSVSEGIASWYGERYHGRRTASGERFNMKDATAAHPTLPFGTRVKVTNLANGRSAVVRINDRGPYTKRRIIDVSWAVARTLGFITDGLTRVRVEVVAAPG